MEREPYNKTIEVDLLIPIDFNKLDPMPNCFGKMWDCTNVKCTGCSAQVVCGTKQIETNQDKAAIIEGDTPFLSRCSFSRVDQPSLVAKIKLESGKNTYQDIYNFVRECSGFRDKVTLLLWVNSFLARNKFKVMEGVVYAG